MTVQAKHFDGAVNAALSNQLQQDGICYAITAGRRAPMHYVHVDCIAEIAEAGLTPVIVIGSTNGADHFLFDPIRNPLTREQQEAQFKAALPHELFAQSKFIYLDDVGDNAQWVDHLVGELGTLGIAPNQAVMHYRSKAADALQKDALVKPLSSTEAYLANYGIGSWQSANRDPKMDDVNASTLRTLDLEALTAIERAQFAASDGLIAEATRARRDNPDRAALSAIPVTTLDLSLERLWKEAGISTASIVECADELTLDGIRSAASALLAERQQEKQKPRGERFTVKIASASCNQTGGDWPRNLANICTAIDKAVADGADILALEELGLSGYDRGDDFYYSDNQKTREMLEVIAKYAASKDENLVVSLGHPWFFADKTLPDQDARRKNPLYNRLNHNFNAQSFITGGEIIGMSAKRYLFNYERGYEKRHFEEWNDADANAYENVHGKGREGTIRIELPQINYDDGSAIPARVIPFGSPVIQVGSGERKMNLHHLICEEYWIGSRFDGASDNRDYGRDNPLAQKARDYDITVALNANASPPAANKIDKHYELSKLASEHCDVLVHTDGVGSSGSTFAQFGSRLMAQDGELISEGARMSFADVAYTSQIVQVTPPQDKGHAPHAVAPHRFADSHQPPIQDGPAAWENAGNRGFEESLRNEALWLFDYMRKNKIPGITQALSGGADSAYNVVKLRVMLELAVNELGVEGFMDAFSHLPYRQEVLEAGSKKAAVKTLMDRMLTCVYMGTDNSSDKTLRAAQTLIEGGTREDGRHFEGIGGTFHYRNVQRLVDSYAEIYSGVNPSKLDDAREAEIRSEIAALLQTRKEATTPEELAHRVELLKTSFEEVSHDVLTLARPEHQITYENVQARLRQVLIMMFSNVENKLAIANSNLDEARNSYATWGGDLHGGMIAGNVHKGKAEQLEHMRLLHDVGLDGIGKIDALYWANQNRPSAELLPKGKDGKVVQFDEGQLGRSFEQMNVISHFMLNDRPISQFERKNSPTEVFEKCRAHDAFADDSIETLHDRVRLSYEKWGHAQFKIHGSPVAATWGTNVDHQTSLRTPNISANHRPEQAQLTLHCLAEMAARDGSSFEALTGGHGLKELQQRALLDQEFAARLNSKMWTPDATDGRKMKIETLHRAIVKDGFEALLPKNRIADILEAAAKQRSHQERATAETFKQVAQR